MISFITSDQWAMAQQVGAAQHREGVRAGYTDRKASRRASGAEIQIHGLAGEIAVYNAFGLPLPRFKVGKLDGGADLVTPSGAKCQIKTPMASRNSVLYTKHRRNTIDIRLRKSDYIIMVHPVVVGSQYRLVGYIEGETAAYVKRLWTVAEGAMKDCYSIDGQYFVRDWFPWIRQHFFDWTYA